MTTPPRSSNPVLLVVVLFLGLAAVYWWQTHSGGGAERVVWREDAAAARAEAEKAGKPAILYFTASWCPPCKQMKGSTWADPAVAEELAKNFVAIKVDVSDGDNDLARQFNVSAIPRVQVLRPDGSPGPAKVGYVSADDLIQWLRGPGVR